MRIMLDECITDGPAQTIISFFSLASPPVDAHFVPTFFARQGMKDQEWPKLLPKGTDPWHVITADRDRASKNQQKRLADGPPLYKILPALGITAAYLSGAIQQGKGEDKVRAIVSLWPDIRDFFTSSSAGSRALITKTGGRGYTLRKNY